MQILIVDDEDMQRSLLQGFLDKQGHRVHAAANGREALEVFARHPIELVLLDHRMPDMNGDEVLARIKEASPRTRAIMISAYGAVDVAVRTMRLGADDFFEKPIDLKALLARIEQIEEHLLVDGEAEQVQEAMHHQALPVRMIAESPAIKSALSVALRAAPTPWTVLIRGETGTGKELIARLIHLLSPRKNGPFIELNCAAVPESLFESELFGHEKGAFTGASGRRRGAFEQASQGTLLLDEAGELPLTMQPKLLRAIQEKTITRIGGEERIEVDARIIAATNQNLKAMVGDGRFREDLYFRLNVIEIDIPPLRQRREDIPALVDFFLDRFAPNTRFDNQALTQLSRYGFPGNIRELEHIIQRTTTLSRSRLITLKDLPPEVQHLSRPAGTGLNERLLEVERQMLLEALDAHDWVQTRAAQALGISERVLRYKMERAGISRQ